MASKTSGSHKLPEFRILIELSRRAKHQVKELLKRTETGSFSKGELSTGLNDIEEPLKQMLDYVRGTLDDVSKIKRSQGQTINKDELNAELKEVGKRVKLMIDHSNEEFCD